MVAAQKDHSTKIREGSTSVFRSLQARHGQQTFATVVTIACLCFVLVSYVFHSQSVLSGYEVEIASLRATVKRNSLQLRERVKREITGALEANQEHDVTKRAAEDQEDAPAPTYGTTYTRWGRRDCKGPNNKLIYSGLAAGTYYTHTGGGSNYICLDVHVDYTPGKYVEGGQGSSHLYGVEFRDGAWIDKLFDLSDTEHNSLYLHSLPCSVCMAAKKLDQIMIPGRENCPEGWTTEYKGYVMAGSNGDKHPSEYICVHEQPQVVPGTSGDQKGAFLYMVETQCASLLCEPFVANRELRCVVCTI